MTSACVRECARAVLECPYVVHVCAIVIVCAQLVVQINAKLGHELVRGVDLDAKLNQLFLRQVRATLRARVFVPPCVCL